MPTINRNGPVVSGRPRNKPPILALYLPCKTEMIQTNSGAKNNLSPRSNVITTLFYGPMRHPPLHASLCLQVDTPLK